MPAWSPLIYSRRNMHIPAFNTYTPNTMFISLTGNGEPPLNKSMCESIPMDDGGPTRSAVSLNHNSI